MVECSVMSCPDLFAKRNKARIMKLVKLSEKENALEQELVFRVHNKGGIAEKVTVLGTRGFFDRVVVLPGGRVAFVELKRPRGGRLSPHQILRAERLQIARCCGLLDQFAGGY